MNAANPATANYAGFARPTWDSQAVFRRVLEAMAHPGRVSPVDVELESPPALDVATAAVCLSLLDFETPVWLQPGPAAASIAAYLRFQCGSPIVDRPEDAAFALLLAPSTAPPLSAFAQGNAEQPHLSATVILQVPSLEVGPSVTLRGPGIESVQALRPEGLAPDFWTQWKANQRGFPQGVDVLFTCGSMLAALPRTSSVEA